MKGSGRNIKNSIKCYTSVFPVCISIEFQIGSVARCIDRTQSVESIEKITELAMSKV